MSFCYCSLLLSGGGENKNKPLLIVLIAMQTLILLIFVLSILSFALQLALFRRRLFVALWLVILGAFVYFAHAWAIELSYKAFEQTMADVRLMGNFTVALVAEAIGGILFSIFLIRYAYGEPVRKYFRNLIYLPGLVIFPALFYLEAYAFLQQAGADFTGLAILMSIGFPLAILGLWFMFYLLVPEYDLRLELKFILHVLQLAMAIILAEMLLGLPVAYSGAPVDFSQLATVLLGALALISAGYLWHRYRLRSKMKN